jgi:hypothetical protein
MGICEEAVPDGGARKPALGLLSLGWERALINLIMCRPLFEKGVFKPDYLTYNRRHIYEMELMRQGRVSPPMADYFQFGLSFLDASGRI